MRLGVPRDMAKYKELTGKAEFCVGRGYWILIQHIQRSAPWDAMKINNDVLELP